VGIGKKDFLECLKVDAKILQGRINGIKKFSCYKKVKALFAENLIMKNRV